MKLREYQAKQIFAKYGITIPNGIICHTAEEVKFATQKLASSVVLKPQMGVKGRGKMNAIGFADTPKEAYNEAKRLLSMTLKGEKIQTLLIENKIDVSDELYCAVTIDFENKQPVLIASSEGGVEIETVAKSNPNSIYRIHINILEGWQSANKDQLIQRMGKDVLNQLSILYQIFRDYDAEIVEINPLVRDRNGKLFAADAVLNVNDDSLFRHDDLIDMQADIPVEDPLSAKANSKNWTYIDLGGNIGILSSGAGLTMVILDLITYAGGKAANFLDTAQIDDQGIYEAFELLEQARPFSVLFLNIFAGLNRCDLLAKGITNYLKTHSLSTPLVVRMIGNHEKEGHEILKNVGITPFTSLEKAVNEAVNLSIT